MERLVHRLYGLDSRAEPLAAERDQNCLVHAVSGERYVLKVSNPSEPVPIVDFQIAALDHIAGIAPSLPVPRVVRTLAGRAREAVRLPDSSRCTLRMLTYVDGLQARETGGSAAQRRAMARYLAELDTALAGFTHPAAMHDLLWNVATAHRLRDKLEFIANPDRRGIAALFMDRFTTHVLPRLPTLRAQVIHNDYHLYNVLVAPDDPACVCGIIDFGDMVSAPLVGEVATAASYHMESKENPFAGASQFIGAYHFDDRSKSASIQSALSLESAPSFQTVRSSNMVKETRSPVLIRQRAATGGTERRRPKASRQRAARPPGSRCPGRGRNRGPNIPPPTPGRRPGEPAI